MFSTLHSYFNDNQYPDEAKREEIANACNAVIQKPGRRTLYKHLCQSYAKVKLYVALRPHLGYFTSFVTELNRLHRGSSWQKGSQTSAQPHALAFAGKKLSDFERVTSLKVYNWFANRRKEIKRRANIGKVLPQLHF